MPIGKPICERWVEEADAREVREMAALVDGEFGSPAPLPAGWSAGRGVLATIFRAIRRAGDKTGNAPPRW